MSGLPTAHLTSAHLTDDQFTEAALDLNVNARSSTHLAACELCRQELLRFEDAVGDLKVVSLEWSQAQPCVSLRMRAEKQAYRPFYAAAASTAAAACFLAVAMPVVRHHQQTSMASSFSEGMDVPDDSVIEIAQDNILMRDVSAAIGEDEASPLREYGISRAEVLHTPAKSRTRNQ